MSKFETGQKLVAVEKVSGLPFLRRVEEIWSAKEILVIGENVTSGIEPHVRLLAAPGSGWWEADFQPDDSDLIAQISNSSGTTGAPKAIAISRRAISDTVTRLIEGMEIDSSIREYVAVPTTFSFGLGRIRAVGAAGGASYIPAKFRPDEIGTMLQRGNINSLSAVPTMLRVLLANPELLGGSGPLLRWLEIGSQYMTGTEKDHVRRIFPNAVILQHYGLTEASRSTFLRVDTASDDQLESVGRAGGDVQVAIDEIGRIVIAGPHLASGIISDGQIQSIANPEGWFTTSDLGEMRDGNLFFSGRADDVVNIGGVKISSEHFERLLSERTDAATPIAACRINDTLRGEKLGIFCETDKAVKVREPVMQTAAEIGLRPGDFTLIEIPNIPRTETGKIARHMLAGMAEEVILKDLKNGGVPKEAYQNTNPRPTSSLEAVSLVLQEALGVDSVDPDDTFYDLGGDSLSAVGVLLRFEEMSLPNSALQELFEGRSVAQIAAAIDSGEPRAEYTRPTPALRVDALNSVRGIFALLIVASHWAPFFIERMGVIGSSIWFALAPLLRIGTPGFAMVYGMGLGLLFFGQLRTREEQLRKRLEKNSRLLMAGAAITALALAARLHFTGEGFGPAWQEQVFYTVLLFYVLIVPTSLIWLKVVGRAKNRVIASLILALLAYALYGIFTLIWPENTFTGWASLAWHIAVAPYAYPRLLGAVALGLAAALWLRERDERGEKRLAGLGAIFSAVGVIFLMMLPGGLTANAGAVWAVLPFAGVTLLLYSGAFALIRNRRANLLMQLGVICGILAFPIFIAQGLVIPIYNILQSFGLSFAVAVGIPAGCFLLSMLWLGRRAYILRFRA